MHKIRKRVVGSYERVSIGENQRTKEHAGPDVLQDLESSLENDKRRLPAMDYKRISSLLKDTRKKKVKVAELFHVTEDLFLLSRSSSSVLKNDNPSLSDIRMSDFLKKHHVLVVA